MPTATNPTRASKCTTFQEAATHDAKLVSRFKRGDIAAFEEIIERHRHRLFPLAFRLLRNQGDAEEVVQDTFVRAYRNLRDFRGDSSLATWLHRITLNLARNRYWHFHRRRRHDTLSFNCELRDDSTATFSDLIASDDAGPRAETMCDEFVQIISTCMQRLPREQREILEMRNVLNRSYNEIASSLDIGVGTVKSRIARARGQLRMIIGETCPEFGAEAALRDWFEAPRESGVLKAALC